MAAMAMAMAVGAGTIGNYVLGAVIKVIGSEFGWPRGAVSAGISLFMLGAAAGIPIFGVLVDRWGPRLPSLISIGVFAASILLAPLIGDQIQYFGLFLTMGFVSGGSSAIPYSVAIAANFEKRRGLAMGLGTAGTGLGGVLMAHYTAIMLERYGWRIGFVALGGLVIVVSVPALWFGLAGVSPRRGRTAPLQPAEPPPWKSRPLWLIAAAVGLVSLAVSGLIVHAVPLMTDRGMTPTAAAAVMSGVAMASLIGRIVGGYLMDRVFAPRVAAGFFLLAVLSAFLAVIGGSGLAMRSGIICMGLVAGAETDVMSYVLSRYCSIAHFGKVYGFMILLFATGSAVAVYLMGRCFDIFGSYDPGVVVIGGASLLAAIVVSRLGPYEYDMKA